MIIAVAFIATISSKLECSNYSMTDSLFGETVISYPVEMEKWIGSLAVVTGASSGIGAGIVRAFAKYGINVVGIARRIEIIKQLAEELSGQPGKVYGLKCDLTKEDCVLQTFAWIEETLGPISILVNNAGLIQPTTYIDGDMSMIRKTIDVNVTALVICTNEAVKSMHKHDIAGHVINIGSITGHYVPEMPYPALNIYPATKFAVTAITEALRKELRYKQSKVKVTVISPGLVATELFENVSPENGLKDGVRASPALKPEDIANTCMYVLGTPQHVQVHDIVIRVQGEMI